MAGTQRVILLFAALLLQLCVQHSTVVNASAHHHQQLRRSEPSEHGDAVHLVIHHHRSHEVDDAKEAHVLHMSKNEREHHTHHHSNDEQADHNNDVKDASGSGGNDTSTPGNVLNDLKEDAKGIKIGRKLLAGIGIIVGLVVCFAGYKLFRPTVFVCGFLVGGLLTSVLIESMFKSKDWMETAAWVGFIVGGLALGALVVYLYKLSIFVAGCAGGVMLAMTIATPIGKEIAAKRPEVVFIVLAILLGILGGVLALKIERPLLIGATSLVGAELFVWGVGYFAGKYPTAADLRHIDREEYEIPAEWWAYLAAIIVMFIAGMVVQYKKTGTGEHHKLEK